MSYPNETHHCGAKPGEPHKDWDDVARCYISGQQLITCDDYWVFDGKNMVDGEDEGSPNPDHQCHPSIWDGDYPGVKQCEKYMLYAPHITLLPKSLTPGPLEMGPDVSTLYLYGKWDMELQQHVISPDVMQSILRNRLTR